MGQLPFTSDEISSILSFAGRIVTGQYTGTGTYGAANQCRIECEFEPKFVLIKRAGYGATYYCITAVNPQKTVVCNRTYNSTLTATMTWEETAVSWYSTNADNQLNTNNAVYDYLIVG